ncbi:uncharacterized protein LOC142529320 [Primulina tabacum]|uniref:uncharacterized protein LOC142529320 n=1 Tax=Primulina tabacum TaxID=48773 RepID=UPI003F5915CB
MEFNSSKEKNVMVDIEIGETTSSDQILGQRKVKKSFNKLMSGILNFKGDPGAVKSDPHKAQGQEVGRMDRKFKKPPRHPKAPLLDAGDTRFVKDIVKVATKKRERMVYAKALKKMKATKSSSPSSAPSTSTISAMVITVVFFVVMICQGLGSKNSTLNAMLLPLPLYDLPGPAAPQPSPEPVTGA